jgi:hypothetical protein
LFLAARYLLGDGARLPLFILLLVQIDYGGFLPIFL